MSSSQQISLNRIPPEIWLEIFNEACTDTGLTGRSLASVSHFFSSVSQPAKYRSIALHGFHQILAFASILTEIPVHLCRVKYLFITKTPLPSEPGAVSKSSVKETSDALWAILTTIAPTIEILHIDFVTYEHHPIPFPSFPRLRDLQTDSHLFELDMMETITDSESASYSESTGPRALLPVLRYWHITTVPPRHFGMTFFTRLPALAPSLSHIRVEDVCFMPGSILRGYNRSLPSLDLLPSSIQKLYVKPLMTGARNITQAFLMRTLQNVNALGDARFVLLSPYLVDRKRYTVGDWLERVNGGEGCWSLREKVLPGEEGTLVIQ